MPSRERILVVANRTAESPELLTELRERNARRPVEVTLLVPATWEVDDPHGGNQTARRRLRLALERMGQYDLEATGVVGDCDPLTALQEIWDPERFDDVIVCTLPSRLSVWLKRDLPRRAERLCGRPVKHLVGTERRPTGVPA